MSDTATATPTKAKRINDLKDGESVTLKFHGSKRLGNEPWEDTVVFHRFEGEGDDKRAFFDNWEAYRYNGHWAYGSSAEKLTIAK